LKKKLDFLVFFGKKLLQFRHVLKIVVFYDGEISAIEGYFVKYIIKKRKNLLQFEEYCG